MHIKIYIIKSLSHLCLKRFKHYITSISLEGKSERARAASRGSFSFRHESKKGLEARFRCLRGEISTGRRRPRLASVPRTASTIHHARDCARAH